MHKALCQTLYQRKQYDHLIIHVGTNKLDSARQAEMIAKFIIDVAKSISTVSIPGIAPRNNNVNSKALDANDQFLKMCREAKLYFITLNNINLREDLNKSRLHLNRNGSDKIRKNFVNF